LEVLGKSEATALEEAEDLPLDSKSLLEILLLLACERADFLRRFLLELYVRGRLTPDAPTCYRSLGSASRAPPVRQQSAKPVPSVKKAQIMIFFFLLFDA
jgi:hypothetical protein